MTGGRLDSLLLAVAAGLAAVGCLLLGSLPPLGVPGWPFTAAAAAPAPLPSTHWDTVTAGQGHTARVGPRTAGTPTARPTAPPPPGTPRTAPHAVPPPDLAPAPALAVPATPAAARTPAPSPAPSPAATLLPSTPAPSTLPGVGRTVQRLVLPRMTAWPIADTASPRPPLLASR